MKTITEFELISHGFDHSQYFQGCGTSFTNFDEVVTGCGDCEKKAFDDALEQLYGQDHKLVENATWDIEVGAGELSSEVLEDLPEDNEMYYYYSIRYNLGEQNEIQA